MKNLLTGYVITTLAFTAAEGVGNIIHSLCELAVNSINLQTAHKQLEISRLAAQQEKEDSSVKAIGFAVDLEGDDDEYDDKT